MLFNSLQFAGFLAAVVALHWTLPSRWRNPLLLAASYVFYGVWDWRFLGLLLLSTATDYTVARVLESTEDPSARRRLLWVSITVNLGVLGLFKYANFFMASGAALLASVGLEPNPTTLQILLPVGISFYTFQTLGYTIDVYRRQIPAERDPLAFALFVSFFPQLVAGPIERASRLLPQLKARRSFPSDGRFGSGLVLILQGLFRKVVIADGVAAVAAPVGVQQAGSLTLWFGMLAFMLRFYGDFAGYTDIARGTARLLGVELTSNFEQPLFARSFTEFWQRWHISLSTWLRDYLFNPLRRRWAGQAGAAAAAVTTLVLAGLWHGATAVFVLWGLVNGLALVAERAGGRRPILAREPYVPRHVGRNLAFFHLAGLAFVLIQTGSVGLAVDYWVRLFALVPGRPSVDAMALVLGGWTAMLVLDVAQRRYATQEPILRWSIPMRGLAYGTMGLAILAFSGGAPEPFIYFQF